MLKLALIVLIAIAVEIKGHGYILNPAMRSSIWRVPEFEPLLPPVNTGDDGIYCDRILQDEPTTNCGVCGDPFAQAVPRDNEIGGFYYRGIITGDYITGQTIDIVVNITIPHSGQMGLKLCTDPENETQECFEEHPLSLPDGSLKVPVDLKGIYTYQVNLPEGVTCEHCIIQWNYRASLPGDCGDGTTAPGCGPQQTFRGCSDVKISANVH